MLCEIPSTSWTSRWDEFPIVDRHFIAAAYDREDAEQIGQASLQLESLIGNHKFTRRPSAKIFVDVSDRTNIFHDQFQQAAVLGQYTK